MRFNNDNYLKAFPRDEAPQPVKIIKEDPAAPEDVLEEAKETEKQSDQPAQEPDPGPIQPGDLEGGDPKDGT